MKSNERHSHYQRKNREKDTCFLAEDSCLTVRPGEEESAKHWKTTLQFGEESMCSREDPGTLPGP